MQPRHPPGHPPELSPGLHGHVGPEPGITYLLLRRLWRVGAAVLRFSVDVRGLEHIPHEGGWIAAGLPHRTWIDPFLLWGWLPPRPRLVFFGDAVTMSRSPLRRFVVARLGGVVPIPSAHSPATAATHIEAARGVLATDAVFCLFPETGRPSRPGEIRRLGSGLGYIALRARAPIVPIVIGGNDELYLGRRIVVNVLPPLDPAGLAGIDPIAGPPPPGSKEERAAVHRLLGALADEVGGPVASAQAQAQPARGTRRIGRRLTTLFR